MTTGPQYIEPTQYHLQGTGLTVQYSTSSIAGVPLLSADWKGQRRSFRGDEIRVAEAELGRLVTVTLESVPDLKHVTLTIAIPGMNLDGHDGSIRTFAVVTTSRTSIAGPRLVHGQIDLYENIDLSGKAEAAVF
ncbi:MAG: hypothetical protein R3B70_09680 [Polyangiaceae bacterium]